MSFSLNNLEYLEADLIAFRHDVHQNPELGFQETRTAGKVAAQLHTAGLEVHTGVGGTGVVGVLRCGDNKQSVLLRADMDALPINEKTNLEYSSANSGAMHACGHDGHTTMLLGAAQHLAKHGGFNGTVYFLFQPNEEHGLGAQAMLDDGLLQRFPADEVYALHNMPGTPLGTFSTRVGDICASETLFDITINGKGGHSSMPHVGVDAIPVGAELVQALQTIVARKLAPSTGAVVSVTEFITDGMRNVLAGQAIIKGDFRARTPEDRQLIDKFMRQICAGVAAIHQVDIDADIRAEFIETINATGPCGHAVQAAQKLGLTTIADSPPMPFSEDFAHFAAARPGCFAMLGNGTEGAHAEPLHSSHYDFNDAAILTGSAYWVQLVLERMPCGPSAIAK